jgi:hypothetical protein
LRRRSRTDGDNYLYDKIGDMRSELSKKNELIEILQQSFNNVLKTIGVESKVLVLPTNNSVMKNKVKDIETEVQSISNKENKREQDSVKKEKLTLNENFENLKEPVVEPSKPEKDIDRQMKKEERPFKRQETKKQTIRKDDKDQPLKREESINKPKKQEIKKLDSARDKKAKTIDAPLKRDLTVKKQFAGK